MRSRIVFATVFVVAAVFCVSVAGFAADYPTREIEFIAAVAPRASSDWRIQAKRSGPDVASRPLPR